MNKEDDLTEGVGRGVEGNTLKRMRYISKLIKLKSLCKALKGGNGEGMGWDLREG